MKSIPSCCSVCLLFFLCLLPFLSGCEKPPTWGELTGSEEKQPAATPVAVKPAETTQQPVAETPKPETPKPKPKPPTAAELLARFNKIPTTQRSDSDLAMLASLTEGLDQILELNLDGSPVTDAGLHHLQKFPALKKLTLVNSKLSPNAYLEISKLTSLDYLSLERSNIKDDTLACVQNMIMLKTLNLNRTAISDNGFVHFKKLENLEELNVGHTGINGSGFKVISKSKNMKLLQADHTTFGVYGFVFIKSWNTLEYLGVSNARVNDNSLKGIRGLKNLRSVQLGFNQISNEGLKQMSSLLQLEIVNVERNKLISGAGIFHLKNCKNIKELNLDETNVTFGDVTRMKKFFNGPKIVWAGQET